MLQLYDRKDLSSHLAYSLIHSLLFHKAAHAYKKHTIKRQSKILLVRMHQHYSNMANTEVG